MAQEFPKVLRWLRENKRISVPDDWLEACIEWVLSENESQPLSIGDLCSAVYDQWLVADLHEIGASCLPPEVATDPKYTLTGCFGLQVNSVTEVSHSFYSQLQKVTGTENANVLATASESTQRPTNDTNGGRMLMLLLTDGVVNLKGMEYRPISSLRVDMSAGFKILVHGTVLCRCGVMMLTAENVVVLGGEVDSLADAARPETIISTNLGNNIQLCETRPDLPRAVFDKSRKIPGSSKLTSGSKTLPQVQHSRHASSANADNIDFSDDDDILISSTLDADCYNINIPKTDPTKQGNIPVSVRQPISTVQGPSSFNDGRSALNSERRDNWSSATASEVLSNKVESDFMDFEDVDDDFLQNCMLSESYSHRTMHDSSSGPSDGDREVNLRNNMNSERSVASKLSSRVQEIKPASKLISNESREKKGTGSGSWLVPKKICQSSSDRSENHASFDRQTGNQLSRVSNSSAFQPSCAGFNPAAEIQGSGLGTWLVPKKICQSSSDRSENHASFDRQTGNQLSRVSNSSAFQPSCARSKPAAEIPVTSVKLEPRIDLGLCSSYLPSTDRKVGSEKVLNDVSQYKTIKCDNTQRREVRDSFPQRLNRSERSRVVSICFFQLKRLRQIRRSAGEEVAKRLVSALLLSRLDYCNAALAGLPESTIKPLQLGRRTTTITDEPFTYISLLSHNKPSSQSVFKVKAYVATLLSRLEYNNGTCWSLTVKINDGSSTLDAVIHDEMLTSLIGFTAEESMKIKEGKTDKKLRIQLTEGVRRCQETLASMSAILEISFNSDSNKWCIERFRSVTSDDLELLERRVSRAM